MSQHVAHPSSGPTADPSPAQLWRTARAQLQADLPKATFEAWVQPLTLLEGDGELISLQAPDEYSRDWVADRLGSTIRRVLNGVAGRSLNVRFSAAPAQAADPTTPQAPPFEDPPALPAEFDPQAQAFDRRLQIVLRFRRYWEALVDPERVISLSQYFIRHWLPLLGPTNASLVLAFKQLRYLNRAGGGEPFEVSGAEILRWFRADESTLYRRLGEPHPLLGYFIEPLPYEDTPYERDPAGQLRRRPRRYAVYGGEPLIPAHHQALDELLRRFGAGADPHATSQALDRALALPDEALQELLLEAEDGTSLPASPAEAPAARTVWSIVRDWIGRADTTAPFERLATQAEKLENRILRPDRALLLTWYFVQSWQPLLSSAAYWLVIVMRSRGFYDRRSGDLRDSLWVDGGYAELASILGVSSESIAGWLRQNRKASETRSAETLPRFVRELERTRGRDARDRRRLSVRFQVAMIDPLIPEDEIRLQARARADGLSIEDLQQAFQTREAHEPRDQPEIRQSGELLYPENSQPGHDNHPEFNQSGRSDSPEKSRPEDGDQPEKSQPTPGGAPETSQSGSSIRPEKSQPESGDSPEKIQPANDDQPEFRKHLKDLTRHDSRASNTFPESSTQENKTLGNTPMNDLNQMLLPLVYVPRAQVQGGGGEGRDWNLDTLLRSNNLPPAEIQRLQAAQVPVWGLAAWLLYAYSQAGEGIKHPGLLASQRLSETPPLFPRREWVELARRGPAFVRSQAELAIQPYLGAPDPLWTQAMGSPAPERLIGLAGALGWDWQV